MWERATITPSSLTASFSSLTASSSSLTSSVALQQTSSSLLILQSSLPLLMSTHLSLHHFNKRTEVASSVLIVQGIITIPFIA